MEPFAFLAPELARLSGTQACRALSLVRPAELSEERQGHLRVADLTTIRCEAYARICHPVQTFAEGQLTLQPWSQLLGAQINSAELPLHEILRKRRGAEATPLIGTLDLMTATALAAQLQKSAEKMYVYFWEGFGSLEDSGLHVYLASAAVIDSFYPYGDRQYQSPTLWWDVERSWFVSTYIDATSTYVGASRPVIDAILATPHFEAQRASEQSAVDDWTAQQQ